MTRIVVGIIRGGTSLEYDLSLRTGAAMLSALPEEKYETKDILIDRSGRWHYRGIAAEPARILAQVDVALNALHGGIGEDGTVQRILQQAGVPYAGSGPLETALASNKARAAEIARAAGIRAPRSFDFTLRDDFSNAQMARAVFSQFGPPYIVKPVSQGASRGVRIADTLLDLPEAIAETLEHFGNASVQEFIRGEDVRVGIIEGFRGEELYALPPAHMLRAEGKRIIDAETRSKGLVRHMVPSNFSHAEKQTLMDAARRVHRALDLSHFSRTDFILSGGKAYLLEITPLPGLYEGAAFPQMLEAVGASIGEFLEHTISLARQAH